MKVKMPDGTIIDAPEGATKADVIKLYRQQSVPDYQQAFQPEGNALSDYANAGAFQLDKFMRGGQNLYAKATGNEALQGQLQAEQAQRDPYMQQLQERSPIASTLGQMAPGMATAAIPGGLMAQTAIGAGLGALDYSPEPALQAVTGGLLSAGGYGLGKAVSKGYNVVRGAYKNQGNTLAAGMRGDMVKKAENVGYELLPGQKAGTQVGEQIDRSIKGNAATASLTQEGIDNNRRVLNRAAIEAMGESGDEIADGMLAKAARRIGSVYDSVFKDVDRINVNPESITSIVDDSATDTLPYFERYLKKYPSLSSGYITGKEAGRLRNLVQKDIAQARGSGFKASPDDLQSFQDLIMESAEEAGGTSREAIKEAGRQWRVMKALERANTVTKGNVNPASMATGLKQYGTTFKRGLLEGQEIDPQLEKLYDAVKTANYFTGLTSSNTPEALQASSFLDARNFVEKAILRKAAKRYIDTGSTATMGMLQGLQQQANPAAGQLGAGLLRGLYTGR